MRFNLDGLEVFFPYDYLYKEQYEYMLHLKRSLDDKGNAMLEMPTGTGKTVCLISLITSYQFQYPKTGKLIYCTRTVPEMTKCMEEIKKVISYRTKLIGPEGGKVLALCLSSRRNMCIHPKGLEEGDRERVDTICRNMTASWMRNRLLGNRAKTGGVAACESGESGLCEYYERYNSEGTHAEVPYGIYSLDDLKDFGTEKRWCPYFMTRHLINHASILVYNYQYMLDPKVSNIVSRELEAESIVVFDEAHNIDNVCIEALSVTIDKRMINASLRSVNDLATQVDQIKKSDSDKLMNEYRALVSGLAEQQRIRSGGNNAASSSSSSSSSSTNANTAINVDDTQGEASQQQPLTRMADNWMANPVLSNDILEEAVPGNIRKAEHFVAYLKKVIVFMKSLFNGQNVENKSPLAFLHQLQTETGLERKPLRFTYIRLNSLLRTLEITNLDNFTALQDLSNFITLVSTYLDGFAVIIEPHGSIVAGVTEPLVQLACLDASIAIKPVLERFQSVVITSGTLSPIDLYPKLLNFKPVVSVSLPMSTFRPCLLPLIVTRGNDQLTISTKFELRKENAVILNYGQLLIDVVASVPDGICCFFTSYQYMEFVIAQWDRMGILKKVMEYKLIYLETKDVVETTLALDNFRRACDCGRGAVFLSVARGKVAEGIDFDRHYGRCVLLFGIPYQYTLSHVLQARLSYMREKYKIRDDDFLTFDALRQSAQCIGRVIRSKTDYGIVILADSRFNKADKRSRFPPWIKQFVRESSQNLTTEVAVEQIKVFLKELGQPIDQQALRSILMDDQEIIQFGQGYKIPTASIAPIIAVKQEAMQPMEVVDMTGKSPVVQAAIESKTEEPINDDYYDEMHGYLDAVEVSAGVSKEIDLMDVVTGDAVSEEKAETNNYFSLAPISKHLPTRTSLFLFDDDDDDM